MPRYFYDIEKANVAARDDVGVVCANDGIALKQAWAAMPMLVGEADRGLAWQHLGLTVRREDGVPVGSFGITLDIVDQNLVADAIIDAKQNARPLIG